MVGGIACGAAVALPLILIAGGRSKGADLRELARVAAERCSGAVLIGELADELERIVALHDASTIAAVVVEPMAGSTGVLPAPKGYLKRLRDICDKYGILLIFDEVITGFGRLGTPFAPSAMVLSPI